ncbi:MAG: nitroreductase family protein [Candidatus Aminicenantes bacterium]|nr:nitroreductase family protein [Candidatus Aminicenantes bacterium]
MIDEKLIDVIKSRRSIRGFDLDRKVENKLIWKLIESANWAPSACNSQAWHFIVIDDQKILNDLVLRGLKKAKDTPVLILVFYRRYVKNQPINPYLDDQVQSASAAIQNLLLMAHNLGLRTCWVNGINAPMEKFLKIPFGYEFIAMIRLGYPSRSELVPQPRKYRIDDIISYNHFSLPRKDLSARSEVMFEKLINHYRKYRLFQLLKRFIPRSLKNKFRLNKDIQSFKKKQ